MQYNASNRLHRHRDTGDGNVWRNYAYDSRGNVTNNGTIGFTYDRAERPVSITGGASGSFTYDAHGRRVKQVVGGQTIYSVYSAGGTLLYRDNATTSTATDYIRMGGRAIARVRGSDVEWTYADHLGSPAAAASQTGAILWREDHTPFGEARQAPAANADNEGFTGHIADAASGLVYMQARYYDPVVGRFLSNDPVGFAQGGPGYFNRYAYTANDPVNHIDPDGEAIVALANPWVRGAIGGAVGAVAGTVVNAAVQYATTGEVNVRDALAAGGASGALGAAIAVNPLLAKNLVTLSSISGTAGGAGSVAGDVANGRDIDMGRAAASTVGGAFGGPIGSHFGRGPMGDVLSAVVGESVAAGTLAGTEAAVDGANYMIDAVRSIGSDIASQTRQAYENRKEEAACQRSPIDGSCA
jgi:RHS repeat-associated protein